MTAKYKPAARYFIPALLLSALVSLTTPATAVADTAAWQVQQANMIYQNSGMANAEGMLAGTSARIGFDPDSPEGGTFDMSFSTTGLFLPRDAMATRDPKKLQGMAAAASDGTLTATRMERRGDTIGVTANMSINGQTRPIIFNMTVAEGGNEAGRSLRLTGQFVINRPAFATKEIGYIGPANIPVKFDVTAITQAAAPATETAVQGDPNAAPADNAPQATEPGAQMPVQNTVPQRRLLTEEDVAEAKKEKPEIGVVRTFGGGASAATPDNPSEGASEIGKVRTFGGTP